MAIPDEILKAYREKSKKLRERKTRAKSAEGYKYYTVIKHNTSSGQHRVYFRNLNSAKTWVKKHTGLDNNVYDLNDKSVWEL
jgi:hypothetical protein